MSTTYNSNLALKGRNILAMGIALLTTDNSNLALKGRNILAMGVAHRKGIIPSKGCSPSKGYNPMKWYNPIEMEITHQSFFYTFKSRIYEVKHVIHEI